MKTEIESINKELAMEYLKLNRDNRNVNNDIVLFYASQMLRGEWLLTHQGIAINKDHTRLLDGQHRLLAIVKADIKVQMMVVHVDDDSIFKVVDTGKVRNAGDILSIANISNSTVIAAIVKKKLMISRNNTVDTSSKMIKLSNNNILDEYNNNKAIYDETMLIGSRCYLKNRLITHSEVSAYMAHLIQDKKHDKDKVYSFFYELFSLKEITNPSIQVLRDKIINASLSNTLIKPRSRQSYVALVWNAYIIGKQMKILRVDKKTLLTFK